MKKILILAILLILTACGGRNETPYEPTEPTTPPATTTPAPTPQPTPTPDRWANYAPLLWRATSPTGQTMYLFGTIHAARADLYPLPDFIMDAFHRSDYLMLEIDPRNQTADFDDGLALHRYTDGRTVADDIGEELHAKARALLDGHRNPLRGIDNFDNYTPFVWYSAFTTITTEQAGLYHRHGVDMHFFREALLREIDILEANPFLEQQESGAGMSMELQVLLLHDAVINFNWNVQTTRELYESWVRGDGQAIMEITAAVTAVLPAEFSEAALIERDILMAGRARELMAEGKKVFFAAGMLHFLHDRSIIALLEEAGYEIVRVMT